MIKFLVLLFNLIGLFICHLFFQSNVTIVQDMPVTADAGSSFVVEVTINKADVSGFAKFEEDFPKGFTVTAIKKEGATILSSEKDIRYIWSALPSTSVIKISFKVTVGDSVSGKQSFSGKFLYVVNNERQEADAAPAEITINAPKTNVAVAPAWKRDTAPINVNQPVGDFPNNRVSMNLQSPAQTQPLTVTRTLSATTVAPAGDMMVKLVIHRGTVTGFAKLEETIPNGVVAEAGENGGASFTFVDNKAKFVWLNLPPDTVFTVSYKVTPGSNISGDQSISGEFSYLLNDNATKFIITPATFTVQNSSPTQPQNTPPVVVTPTVPPAVVTPTVAVVPTVAPAVTVPPVVVDTAKPKVTQPVVVEQPKTVVPEVTQAKAGVNYRVQIMALHHAVESSYLGKKYSITENIKEEMAEGYTKYMVGGFDEYKAVRDHREEIRGKGVAGPFVVAYTNGKRITVQEALMITKQQWYK